MDFTGFTFNNQHSLDFGIYRVSDGSRYQDSLIPTSSDYTTDIQGGEGTFYWGSNFKSKPIVLNIAFDNVTELQLRRMRQWLSCSNPANLIFDELPYKYYTGKISGEPQFSYVCFNEPRDGKMTRIYKGEGTFNFICYYPFARSTKKFLDLYNDKNIEEWKESSGMLATQGNFDVAASGANTFKYYNPGDRPTDWKISFKKTGVNGLELTEFSIDEDNRFAIAIYGTDKINDIIIGELENELYSLRGTIEIDTKKRMITFITEEGKRIPALFLLKEGDFFKLPISTTKEGGTLTVSPGVTSINGVSTELIYDYLYY